MYFSLRTLGLGADFSAPIALTLTRTRNRSFDLHGLIFTRENLRHAGLYQFQLYDPRRVPVILVHGLMSDFYSQTPLF
jgi:hypothetical protein